MKIFYPSLIETNAGWGAECFLNAAFIAAGAQTLPLDFTIKQYRLGDKFLQVDDFDIFFLQFGAHFPLPLVKVVNRPRFFYCSELVARYHAADHLFKSGLFDHYFVRGPACARELVARGWLIKDKISTHLSAFDPNIYQRLNVVKDIDVLFIGCPMPRRKKIIERLSSRFEVKLMSAYAKDACRLFNRAKIVLNIHAEDYLDTETRIFEVLGSGAFLISEKLSEENPFRNDELIQVESIDEMEEKINYYLNRPNERKIVADRGYEAALSKHTYLDRAEELIHFFNKYLPSNEGPALDLDAVHSYARWKHVRRMAAFAKHLKWNIKTKLLNKFGVAL